MRAKDAKEMGKKAFKIGINAAPILDEKFMDHIHRLWNNIHISNLLLAWHEGWTEANLEKEI